MGQKLYETRSSPVLPCFAGSESLSLHGSSCVIPLAEAENLQRKRQTCWEHLLGSLPLFLPSLPSLHPSLSTSLQNLSLPFLSSASIFPSLLPLPHLIHLASLFHSSILASPLYPITSVTGELSKHPLRCWSTLHAVKCHLCITQDVVRMILLGWHVSPEDIMFTLCFLLKIDIFTMPEIMCPIPKQQKLYIVCCCLIKRPQSSIPPSLFLTTFPAKGYRGCWGNSSCLGSRDRSSVYHRDDILVIFTKIILTSICWNTLFAMAWLPGWSQIVFLFTCSLCFWSLPSLLVQSTNNLKWLCLLAYYLTCANSVPLCPKLLLLYPALTLQSHPAWKTCGANLCLFTDLLPQPWSSLSCPSTHWHITVRWAGVQAADSGIGGYSTLSHTGKSP